MCAWTYLGHHISHPLGWTPPYSEHLFGSRDCSLYRGFTVPLFSENELKQFTIEKREPYSRFAGHFMNKWDYPVQCGMDDEVIIKHAFRMIYLLINQYLQWPWGRGGSVVRAQEWRLRGPGFESCWPVALRFGTLATPFTPLPVSFEVDTKSNRSLLSGVGKYKTHRG